MDNKQLCELGCLCEDCFARHIAQGCSYGQPDCYGEDFINDCDCDEDEWAHELAAWHASRGKSC